MSSLVDCLMNPTNCAENAAIAAASRVVWWPLTVFRAVAGGNINVGQLVVGVALPYWYFGGFPSLSESAGNFVQVYLGYGVANALYYEMTMSEAVKTSPITAK